MLNSLKVLSKKKIIEYTNRRSASFNDILSSDHNLLTFKFSAYGSSILYQIMKNYYDSCDISSEQIVNNIDFNLGSRNSILNLINVAEKKKLIEKVKSKSDARQKFIRPTKMLIASHEKMITYILSIKN